LAKKVAIIAIITSNKKRSSYFAKNWKRHFVSTLLPGLLIHKVPTSDSDYLLIDEANY
jgi:hypothetical protein